MSQDQPTDHDASDLAERLIAADTSSSEAVTPNHGTIDPMFEMLLDTEQRFEERVRRLAILAWCLAFGCLCALAAAMGIVWNFDGTSVEIARVVLVVVMVTGGVSLIMGGLATARWLFSSRTPTLRAIERRLAALEKSLSR
ncbi:MAG: hypothetical protein MPN21_12750 [Thermoanaerobaculia bacterium]|nr:hypothetical protein [Thermoanaerobaculia bacterium]